MKVQYGESRFRWHLCRSCCLHNSRWWELGKKFNSKEEQVTKNTEDQLSAAAATGGSAVKEIRALGFVQAQEANFTVFCLFGVLNLWLNCMCSEYTRRCLVKSCNFCQLHHFKKKKPLLYMFHERKTSNEAWISQDCSSQSYSSILVFA